MTSINALIIDDEPKACNVLNSLLEQYCPDINHVDITNSPDEGLEMIKDLNPNVIFLDINMPGKSGFQLLDELESFEGKIVFTTAYHEHAIKAFRYHAFDYLLKPLIISDLIDCCQRLVEELKKTDQNSNIQELFNSIANQNSGKEDFPESIAIYDKGGMLFIKSADILFLEGDGNYTKVKTVSDVFLSTKTLKNFERLLDPEKFLRVHKSFVVNVQHISRYAPNDGGELTLADNTIVPVSRRKRKLLERFAV